MAQDLRSLLKEQELIDKRRALVTKLAKERSEAAAAKKSGSGTRDADKGSGERDADKGSGSREADEGSGSSSR